VKPAKALANRRETVVIKADNASMAMLLSATTALASM
jgi:hypothetical protein